MRNPRHFQLLVVALLLVMPSCAHLGASMPQTDGGLAASSASRLADSDRIIAGRGSSSAPMEHGQPFTASAAVSAAAQQVAFEQVGGSGRETLPLPLDESAGSSDEMLVDRVNAPAVPSGGAFTVGDLEQIALANNPTVQQAAAVVAKARGIRTQVGLYPNPTIGYSAEEMGDNGTAGKQGGFISQTFVTGGKLSLSEAVADREIQSLVWELESQRYRVRNAVRAQFYEVLGAQQRVQIAERLLSIAARGSEISEELLEAQQAARPDVLQARIQLNEVRILLQNAHYDYEAAWKQLATLIGQPDMAPAALNGTLDAADAPVRDFEAAYAELVAASPELQAARARVARARVQIRRQEVQPIPNLQTQVTVAHDNENGDNIASVQVGVPLPIFNRNQGNIQLAVAEYRRALNDVRRLELVLQNRLAVALRDYSKARSQAELYRNQILPTAQENLELTEEAYRQGEFDLIRALTARRSFFETNLAYVSSLVALRQADVAITGLLLTGGLNDVPDAGGGNLQGVGLRDEALSGQ